jgi:hypothetical protein
MIYGPPESIKEKNFYRIKDSRRLYRLANKYGSPYAIRTKLYRRACRLSRKLIALKSKGQKEA